MRRGGEGCGLVWSGVLTELLPKGNGRGVLLTHSKTGRGVRVCVLYVACVYAPAWRPGLPLRPASLVESRLGDPLPLRLLVQLRGAHALVPPVSYSCLNEALS